MHTTEVLADRSTELLTSLSFLFFTISVVLFQIVNFIISASCDEILLFNFTGSKELAGKSIDL